MPDGRALNTAVRRALKSAPVSLREIARRSRVSHVQLYRLVVGERNATPEVAKAVLGALDSIGSDCANAAAIVRRALTLTPEEK